MKDASIKLVKINTDEIEERERKIDRERKK